MNDARTPAALIQIGAIEVMHGSDALGPREWREVNLVAPDSLQHGTPVYIKGDGPAEAVRQPLTESERDELERLRGLINTPHTAEWTSAVELEAAHQQERWGAQGDAGKTPADWFWLLGYLSGKALMAIVKGDAEYGLHHIISSSAVLLNWHRAATGTNTSMRPGIDPAAHGIAATDAGIKGAQS